MTRLLSRLRGEDGQVIVLVAVFMTALIGMAALVVDVGSWFHQQRATQSTVDAAALAGAQALPDTAAARAIAKDYAAKNAAGGAITDSDITFSSTYAPNDTIVVRKAQSSGAFFSKIFGISSGTVHAHAAALYGPPSEALYVAPIVVSKLHRDITGEACGQQLADGTSNPCFGPANPTTLTLGKNGAPGAFDLLNLDCFTVDVSQQCTNISGTTGASTMASWIENGYDKYLPLGGYYSDPGAKYNGNQIDLALAARTGTELLFPVYDTLVDQGSNASYRIIGWIGFHLLSGTLQGQSGTLTGYFTRVLWQGLIPKGGTPPGTNNFGMTSVALVD
jgi:hypothetical protein